MATCELCGKQGSLVSALIEEVPMDVCAQCTKFGKVLYRPNVQAILQKKQQQFKPKEEPQLALVEDYAERIRKKREQLGMKQIDLARMVAEKESIIQKFENAEIEPSIDVARKLERHLKIHLVEEIKDDVKIALPEKSEGFTLGHFIKRK